MDGLARDPDRFVNPHNLDTGETILHLLAKEGKIEILRNLLQDKRVEEKLANVILKQDKLVSDLDGSNVEESHECHAYTGLLAEMETAAASITESSPSGTRLTPWPRCRAWPRVVVPNSLQGFYP